MNSAPDFNQIAGSLDLEAPMQGAANTPDVVDAVWWLGLRPLQACAELGIDASMYPRVRKDIEAVVSVYENRRAQGRLDPKEGAPIIKRRKTRRNAALFSGGRVKRIGSRSPTGQRARPERT